MVIVTVYFHTHTGQTSNTQCLETFGEELVTISNNGQVLVHGSFEFVVSKEGEDK